MDQCLMRTGRAQLCKLHQIRGLQLGPHLIGPQLCDVLGHGLKPQHISFKHGAKGEG